MVQLFLLPLPIRVGLALIIGYLLFAVVLILVNEFFNHVRRGPVTHWIKSEGFHSFTRFFAGPIYWFFGLFFGPPLTF